MVDVSCKFHDSKDLNNFIPEVNKTANTLIWKSTAKIFKLNNTLVES